MRMMSVETDGFEDQEGLFEEKNIEKASYEE